MPARWLGAPELTAGSERAWVELLWIPEQTAVSKVGHAHRSGEKAPHLAREATLRSPVASLVVPRVLGAV
jgi:hypothetical protein